MTALKATPRSLVHTLCSIIDNLYYGIVIQFVSGQRFNNGTREGYYYFYSDAEGLQSPSVNNERKHVFQYRPVNAVSSQYLALENRGAIRTLKRPSCPFLG